jgi:tetratricopeptide (TPR) repeat protein
MSVRPPTALLVLAALSALGWCLSASAKPPDLPVKEKIVCEPAAAAQTGPQAAPAEDDLHDRARQETGRRTLGRCLLFAAHPLLALLPVDEWIEDEEPEVVPADLLDALRKKASEKDLSAGFGIWSSGSCEIENDPGPPFWHAFLHVLRVYQWGDADEPIPDLRPLKEPVCPNGIISSVAFDFDGQPCPSANTDSAAAPGTESADRDAAASTCPYRRQQAAPAQEPADEMPGDPLDNLQKLDKARKLLRQADFFRRAGHPASARFYYGLVQRLCPGSRYDEAAAAQLSRLPAASAQEAGTEEQEPPAEAPFTCPYLRDKAAHEAATPSTAQAPGSVLDNLQKLEHAAQVYKRAESYRRRGRLEEARGCYESVRDLCPGSRFAQLAGERLEQLHAGKPKHADEATGEEEDASPPPAKEEPGKTHSSLLQRESRVATLLEHCRRAFQAGRYDQAARFASQAAALDPASVAANPLVYKLGLLTQLRTKIEQLPRQPPLFSSDGPFEHMDQVINLMHRYCDFFKQDMYAEAELCALQALALAPSNPTVLAAARLAAMQRLTHPPVSEPAACPWATEPHTALRRPDLPPIDPGVVGAMEKILTEVGEPGPEKLTVTVEEQGAAEEQAEPPPSDEEPPTLLLDPPGDDPAEHAARGEPLPDLLDLLRSAACVEADGQPLCGRGQCQVPLGMISARVAWDCRDEHGSFLLEVVIGETDDLRAEQWEQNDRVADWIGRNGGGLGGTDDGWHP